MVEPPSGEKKETQTVGEKRGFVFFGFFFLRKGKIKKAKVLGKLQLSSASHWEPWQDYGSEVTDLD